MNNKNKKEQKRSGGTLALYIIFSIIASIAIWSYITLVENPEVEQSVTNIPITLSEKTPWRQTICCSST